MSAALAERCRGRWPDILRRLGFSAAPPSPAAISHAPPAADTIGSGSPTRVLAAGSAAAAAWAATVSGSSRRSSGSTSRQPPPWSRRLSAKSTPPTRARSPDNGKSAKPSDPMKPWREAGVFLVNSPVDRYFRARALIITESRGAIAPLCERASFTGHRNRDGRAQSPRSRSPTGEALGCHQTFVEHDGQGKAPIERPRLFAAGGKTIGGGVWFGKADAHSEFVVAEGVKSTLSRYASVSRRGWRRGPE